MCKTLLLTRHDKTGKPAPIPLSEWISLVESDPELRLRTEPYCAVNPTTGARFTIPVGEADSEILLDNQWQPFLRYSNGKLAIESWSDIDDSDDPLRQAISVIAKVLDAQITMEFSGEFLHW